MATEARSLDANEEIFGKSNIPSRFHGDLVAIALTALDLVGTIHLRRHLVVPQLIQCNKFITNMFFTEVEYDNR